MALIVSMHSLLINICTESISLFTNARQLLQQLVIVIGVHQLIGNSINVPTNEILAVVKAGEPIFKRVSYV